MKSFPLMAKKMASRPIRISGLSLLEVLMFAVIISVIFLALTQSAVLSIKRAEYNQRKIQATHLAEELREWMTGEKETNWTTFIINSADAPGKTFCMNNATLSWPAEGGDCDADDYSLLSHFRRNVILSGTGSEVTADIHVYWEDSINTYSVALQAVYSPWD